MGGTNVLSRGAVSTVMHFPARSSSRRHKISFVKENPSCLKQSMASSGRDDVEGEWNGCGICGREEI